MQATISLKKRANYASKEFSSVDGAMTLSAERILSQIGTVAAYEFVYVSEYGSYGEIIVSAEDDVERA